MTKPGIETWSDDGGATAMPAPEAEEIIEPDPEPEPEPEPEPDEPQPRPPMSAETIEVLWTDTWSRLADRAGVEVTALAAVNNMTFHNLLNAGTKLRLPE